MSRDMAQADEVRGMSRGRVVALVVGVALLLVVAGSVRWASRPQQVQRLLLSQAGRALGLEITAGAGAEYRLRGTPRVVLRDVVARQPGAATPLFRARRVDVSVPWSTLRSRGAQLDVQRIDLDAPRIDLPALQRWLASRPPSRESRIPTLQRGLGIRDGVLEAPGWRVSNLALELSSLHPGRPVHGTLRGDVQAGALALHLDTRVALSQPAADAGLGLHGTLSLRWNKGQLVSRGLLSGRLAQDAAGLGLDRLRYAARMSWTPREGTPVAFVLGAAGNARYNAGTLTLRPLGLALRGTGVVPRLRGAGALAWGKTLDFKLAGALAAWPRAWPALPAPISASRSPLPFELQYAGASDLSGRAHLHLVRDRTVFDARFHLPAVLAWTDQLDRGTPLPPMDGTLSTPRLEIAGAQLEGVHVELHDDPP